MIKYAEIRSSVTEFLCETTKILADLLEKVLFEIDKNYWQNLVLCNLTFNQKVQVEDQKLNNLEELDLAALLRIFERNFFEIKRVMNLSGNKRQILKNMIEIRHRWAHVPSKEYSNVIICKDLNTIKNFLLMIKAEKILCNKINNLENRIIFPIRKFVNGYDRKRVEKLCNVLMNGTRGITLGKEIFAQLDQGFLKQKTYEKLSRWVNPKKPEYNSQPIAAEISNILFGEKIMRTGD